MIGNTPAWATPVSGLASWIFARMEQSGALATGASIADALTAAQTPSVLVGTFAETGEKPVQTLWRLHHTEVVRRFPASSMVPNMSRPWSPVSQGVPESERVQQYVEGLFTALVLGAQVFACKPTSLPWKEVHRVEERLEQAQSVSGYNRHLKAVRGVTFQVADLGFKARAAALYREEIRMAEMSDGRRTRLTHILRLATAVSTTGLGDNAFPLLKDLIELANDYADTSGVFIQIAHNVACSGLGIKSTRLFGIMLHELRKNPDSVVRSRGVLGIAMSIAQAGLGEKAKELLAEAERIASEIESEEIRRQTLADLKRIA